MTNPTVIAPYVNHAINPADFHNDIWQQCHPVHIEHYWSGEPAMASRHVEARICWSDKALHVRFVGKQQEPLIVADHPITDKKTLGLWDRDVCEIFLAPNSAEPGRYLSLKRLRMASGSILGSRYGRKEEKLIGISRQGSRLLQSSKVSDCSSV